jgi:hypothetical protein
MPSRWAGAASNPIEARRESRSGPAQQRHRFRAPGNRSIQRRRYGDTGYLPKCRFSERPTFAEASARGGYHLKVGVAVNRKSRAHTKSDLHRNLFASCLAILERRTHKGPHDCLLPGIRLAHRNSDSGSPDNRCRIQIFGQHPCPVTSHFPRG